MDAPHINAGKNEGKRMAPNNDPIVNEPSKRHKSEELPFDAAAIPTRMEILEQTVRTLQQVGV